MNETPDYRRGLLRAFADGEGHSVDRSNCRITIGNTCYALLERAQEYLAHFSIESSIRTHATTKKGNQCWALHISNRRNLELFARIIGFSEARKQWPLEDYIDGVHARRDRLLDYFDFALVAPTLRPLILTDDLFQFGCREDNERFEDEDPNAWLDAGLDDDPNDWLTADLDAVEREVRHIKLTRAGWLRGSTGHYSRWFPATKTRPGWAFYQTSQEIARLVQDYLDRLPTIF